MKSKPPNLERLTSAALRKLAPLRDPDEAKALGLLSSEAELARQTGLSPVSLSNFKAGGDIRLSNLLKIAKALGLCLTIKG